MSIKKKGSIPARRLRDRVELFIRSPTIDPYGQPAGELTSIGVYPADVEEAGGGRFAYYQGLGYSHPLTIVLRKPDSDFQEACYNGRMLKISSCVPDPGNREYIRITADWTDGQIKS